MRLPGTRPPVVASWLAGLFAHGEPAESIAGDLREEFFARESQCGGAAARRWYWRQSIRTAADLMFAGLRDSPTFSLFTALAGWFLLPFCFAMPERAIVAAIHYVEHGVIAYPTNPRAWHFWFQNGIFAGRLAVGLLAGSAAARLSRGREMLAGILLAAIWVARQAVLLLPWVVRFWPESLGIWMAAFLPAAFAMAAGAAAVRACGSWRVRRAARMG